MAQPPADAPPRPAKSQEETGRGGMGAWGHGRMGAWDSLVLVLEEAISYQRSAIGQSSCLVLVLVLVLKT
jgi:hypothetical protein